MSQEAVPNHVIPEELHIIPGVIKTYLFIAAFFLLFAFLLYQSFLLIEPFSTSLLWAVVIAFATNPVKSRVLKLLGGRKNLTALLMTVGAFLLVIGPAVYLIFNLTTQILGIYRHGKMYINSEEWQNLQEMLQHSLSGKLVSLSFLKEINLWEIILNSLKDISTHMAAQLGGALKNTFAIVINFMIMIFALFFIYRDGENYYATILRITPFAERQKIIVSRKLIDTFSAVIYGVFLIAFIQATLTGIGMAIFGIPFYLFWGVMAFLTALIPVMGAAFVWVPAAFYLFLQGHPVAAFLFALWGLLLVSTPDNFLRPLLIGNRARLPVFFLYIGILGGLKVYGMTGILLGPLIVTLVLAFTRIYKEDYMIFSSPELKDDE